MTTDVLAPYQHGSDGVVEALEVQLDASQKLTARVVLRVVRPDGVTWARVTIGFTDVELVRLTPEWLTGGGAVLYDGARLEWDEASRRGRLNLDPGVGWSAGQAPKPEQASSGVISGQCDVSLAPLSGNSTHWFSVVLELESTIDGVRLPDALLERSVRLLRAASADEARAKAEALEVAHEYRNESGETVAWRLVEVSEVQALDGELVDGIEVFSRLERATQGQ